ncbi:MAG: hypothetical protein EOS76_18340 [Mesorhizobium sp.]|uniref:hypothetical protein n=1 Tax=unclassified Mesorhizobium TaxID=325217 RepID=UPI000F758663|nr:MULTISPECIES: hypothetical protein [unclassified Mesorhizobium]AZO35467.1 hypothetical protein EJ072_14060 [Mesorhizobium sp. M2A.F.Ca.ET.046.03.2.1]RVC78276.1 hypothetical protein EN766_09770 [Mesorhizobium sp. M2A.F.Ca.ET.046.02.1.1]RWB45869.1 MAG: hypothetical protein EOQ44_10820 [Mesorhizobium sp.]RWE17618.1 MAG: hypothetical protein EOS76_18340 [Mesorhizobium sp.]
MFQTVSNPSPTSITSQYASWFDDRIDQFIDEHKGRFDSVSTFPKRNGYFITISFDHSSRNLRLKGSASIDIPKAKSVLDTFTDIYNFTCRQLIGRNYHRPSFDPLKPLAIGCLDMNGSRYWRSMGQLENPHIHSIWIFGDEVREGFQKLIADTERFSAFKERFSIREMDIQALDHDHRNSTGEGRATSYMAKFIGHNNSELLVGDDFRVLPIPRATLY